MPTLYKLIEGTTHIWTPILSDQRVVGLERATIDDLVLWFQGGMELYAKLPVAMERADLADPDSMEHVAIYHVRPSGVVDAWCVAQLNVLPRGWAQPRDVYTCVEAARLSPRSASWWRNRCAAGAVPGAQKHGKTWIIPYETVDHVRSHGGSLPKS